MQDGHVIAYASRQLKSNEENYPTYHLELVVVVHALNIWMHYLFWKTLQHLHLPQELEVLLNQTELSNIMSQRRWLDLIKDYVLNIQYHPCKANRVANTLSCKSSCDCRVARYEDSLCEEM